MQERDEKASSAGESGSPVATRLAKRQDQVACGAVDSRERRIGSRIPERTETESTPERFDCPVPVPVTATAFALDNLAFLWKARGPSRPEATHHGVVDDREGPRNDADGYSSATGPPA